MAGQPTVVVQKRKEALCGGADIGLASMMKRIVITGCAHSLFHRF